MTETERETERETELETTAAGRLRPLRRALTDLGALLLPVTCAGCGLTDVVLCRACRGRWDGPPRRCEDRAGHLDRLDGHPLPVWALADATGTAREVVVQWKDRGRTDLTPLLSRRLAAAALAVLPGWATTGPGLLVVPAPSSRAARRRRGEHRVGVLTVAVARALTRDGRPARAVDGLDRGRGADQAGLDRRARAANVAGGVRLKRSSRDVWAGRRVLLVDDVLTTGATLAACRSVLERAGAEVVGALVLASTPAPGTGRGPRTASAADPPADPRESAAEGG